MTRLRSILLAILVELSGITLAENSHATGSMHQYWVCGISSYHSIADGHRQDGRCPTNTAYSVPPCREFYVELEGLNGIHPGFPYQRTNEDSSTVTITINKTNGGYEYSHTVNKAGEQWLYLGQCHFYEAPDNEKIYMDQGLQILR